MTLAPGITGDLQQRNRRVAAKYLLALAAVLAVLAFVAPPLIALVVPLGIIVPAVRVSRTYRRQLNNGEIPYDQEQWSATRALRDGGGNPRYQIPMTAQPAEQPRRVYVFYDNTLIATLTGTPATPAQSYRIGAIDYALVSCTGPYTEADGMSQAYDVQVARSSR